MSHPTANELPRSTGILDPFTGKCKKVHFFCKIGTAFVVYVLAMTPHERLTAEVNSLLQKMVDLGNCTDRLTTADLSAYTEDARNAKEWETLLDVLYARTADFARSHNVTIE